MENNLASFDQTFVGTPWISENKALTYNSFSGVDIVANMVLPGEGPIILGELQTISYSIHRENTPVRTLGHVGPINFVKGPRTIAGSLIFTVFDEYAFYRIERYRKAISSGFYPLADMLPPMDISITFSNEYGLASTMKLFGLTIIDEGQTMSVDDMITEQTYTFMARGIQPITRYTPGVTNQTLSQTRKGKPSNLKNAMIF